MIRDFSQDLSLNPDGWIGDNWENKGYDIVSYFPEFTNLQIVTIVVKVLEICKLIIKILRKISGQLLRCTNQSLLLRLVVAFIDYSWELEYNYYNRLNWISDYYPPYLPTPILQMNMLKIIL